MANFPQDCIIPENARIADSVKFGPRVVLSGDGVVLRENVRLDAACVIGEGVNVGQGAWVRAGDQVGFEMCWVD